MNCRGCNSSDLETLIDLGENPLSNSYLISQNDEDRKYPLNCRVCLKCGFVQVESVVSREEIFSADYPYFSSYSNSWLEHSRDFALNVIQEFELEADSLIIEIASNDGYLLQYFKEKGFEVLGIEPTEGTAKIAIKEKNIPTLVKFFGLKTALYLQPNFKPKIMIGINVLAHVPDIHDFVKAFSVLSSNDTITIFEFPHLLNLLKETQFDTIYHEHFSYLNLTSLIPILESHGLRIFNAQRIETHGGSLRIYCCNIESNYKQTNIVSEILNAESEFDPRNLNVREVFQSNVREIRDSLIREVQSLKNNGTLVAYGAAAKGNTLLNFCNVTCDDIAYVVDLNPNKQGKFMPGSKIPIVSLSALTDLKPDSILLLPWNLSNEILISLKSLGLKSKILTAIPKIKYLQ